VSPFLNTRARLERAQRNNVKIQSASDTFHRFKWFSLGLALLLPIYPSLSVIGTDVSAHASDYDDSTIITAYSEVGEGGYISNNGLISSDFTSSPPVTAGVITASPSEDIAHEDRNVRKSPTIVQYTVQAGDTLAKISDRYDVSIDAISWANDLSLTETLKP
jgi:LysM repeat protein